MARKSSMARRPQYWSPVLLCPCASLLLPVDPPSTRSHRCPMFRPAMDIPAASALHTAPPSSTNAGTATCSRPYFATGVKNDRYGTWESSSALNELLRRTTAQVPAFFQYRFRPYLPRDPPGLRSVEVISHVRCFLPIGVAVAVCIKLLLCVLLACPKVTI